MKCDGASHAEPSCERTRELLGELFDRALTGEARVRVERHLAHCRACADYYRDYRAAIAAARDAYGGESDELPTDLERELVRRLREAAESGGGDSN